MKTSLPILLTWHQVPGELEWSPTGISSFLECQRKWAWRKIAKIEAPSGAGADLGGRAHKMWERYLATGERPDFVSDKEAASIASLTLHLLPQPKTEGMLIERHFRFKSARTGHIYHGFKDFELPPGVPQKQLELDGSAPVVGDHKTTKSIDDYAKSADDLQDDAQSVLYGLDAMARFSSPFADLAWIYAQTKGAKRSKPTVTRLHAEQALKVFDVIEEVASEASAVLDAGLQPLDLPPNPDACSAFGGCPYRHLCNLSPSQRARSHMSNSLIANLRARVQGTAAPTVTEKPAEEAKPEAAAPSAPAPSVMGCAPEDVPAPTEIPKAFLEQTVKSDGIVTTIITPPGAINPPESALPPPAPQAAPVEEEKPRRTRRTKAEMAAARAAEAATVDGPAAVTSAPINEPTTIVAEFDVSDVKKQLEDAVDAAIDARREGFTLYVDCIPIGRPAKSASGLIEKAQERMLKEHGVPDYRLIDYGKGVPFFIAFVDEQVDGSFDLVLDTRSPEGAVLLETLRAKASFVVQGLR